MAPDIALRKLRGLAEGSVVLDPMAGSGTVIRHAADLGLQAKGFDLDPLAILMTNVWTTSLDRQTFENVESDLWHRIDSLRDVHVPWVDEDAETSAFIDFWFGRTQQKQLRKIAVALSQMANEYSSRRERAAVNVLRLALSKIVVTKDRGASLARDVSHSRPHRVMDTNDFDVVEGLGKSIRDLSRRLLSEPPRTDFQCGAKLGDARHLADIRGQSVDLVLTSPPYLNAIDYMRGHRLSLVWLGHSLSELRSIRSSSVGSERAESTRIHTDQSNGVRSAMGDLGNLPAKFGRMVDRYAIDLVEMLHEVARVLKAQGKAVFVVGDSCLRGVFVRNSDGVVAAARSAGLRLVSRRHRDLPAASRYLPMTSAELAKRMRREAILSFAL